MKKDAQLEDAIISNSQVETFAYNIYKDISQYIQDNFEEFLLWNLETISISLIMTIDEGICIKQNYNCRLCKYEKE